MNKKLPDNIVFNYENNEYDTNLKEFPTNVGSQNFKPLKVDSTSSYNASNYFNSKFKELKERYEELQNIITIASTNQLGSRGTSNVGQF